ncbi:MAG: helix-turn-helix transcriptional regulator [Phaeodactylibacter sp.]|nr:helix-turn-helix transcriptional regulator [Phaeodactylibacter sp.]MCB9289506.1 helix-turn-helix transcriptional regulator [Lewinellaceae bacterium]
MNTQSNAKIRESRRTNLYKVDGKGGASGHSAHQEMFTLGRASQPVIITKTYPGLGKHSYFVARIRELIETNIDDETYGIDQLCRDAGASRSQLHNKLKKWTGLSTTYFIRSIKLQRAKYLLVQTDLNITQVSFEVGFRDAGYFTRVFCESFGVSPKNFRKRWQKSHTEA